MTIRKSRQTGIELTPENIEGIGGVDLAREGELSADSSDSELKVFLDAATRTVVTEDQTQVLTNKTIDADLNTISDLELDNLKAGVLNVSTTLTGASDLQVASALAVKTYIDDKAAAQNEADEISYDPTASGLVATNVQDAIDEVDNKVDTNASAISSHLSDTTDAHDASAISNIPSGNLLATDVQSALNEIQSELDSISGATTIVQDNLDDHINDTVDAHDASAISNTPSGNLAATEVQAALNELQSDVDSRALSSALTDHINDTTDAHDASAISNIPSGNLAATEVQAALNELQSDIDSRALSTGGTIITPTRLDAKQDTLANLYTYALTATDGQFVWATDTKETYIVKDSTLSAVGGSSGSLSTIVQFTATEQISSWSTGKNAAPMGGGTLGGTFAKETTTPIHGAASYKYTQGASSLNDYFLSAEFPIDLKFRNNGTQYITMSSSYNGVSGDIELVFWDATNSVKIPLNTVATVQGNGTATIGLIFSVSNIPASCELGRIGFQTLVQNTGKILFFDDIQICSSLDTVTNIQTSIVDFVEGRTRTTPATGSTNTSVFYFPINSKSSNGVIETISTTALGTSFRALKKCSVNLSASANISIGNVIVITKNSATLAGGYTNYVSYVNVNATNYDTMVTANVELESGDILRVQTNLTSPSPAETTSLSLIATAQSEAIATPVQQVSSDSINFAFKATAIDPLLDPIGTFNTYTYASSTNTPTISGSAPTQTVSSMNTNGIELFGRGFSSASTSASPARVEIFIGKGLKSYNLSGYVSGNKVNALSYDNAQATDLEEYGITHKYDETKGILSINAARALSGLNTTRYLGMDEDGLAVSTSAYFVFNASKSASIAAIPNLAPRIATLSDIKSTGTVGGTGSTGAFYTRTLNTLIDSTGFVTSLTSNQFELPAGTYYFDASVPFYRTSNSKSKIRNITDSTDVAIGTSESSANSTLVSIRSIILGEITITSPKIFEIQYRIDTTTSTEDLGVAVNFGIDEVYTQLKITKVK